MKMNKYTSQEEVRRNIIKDMVKKRNSIVPSALTSMKERGYYGLSLLSQYYYEQVKEILVDATKILREELERETEERSSMIDAEEHFDVFISYASENLQTAIARTGLVVIVGERITRKCPLRRTINKKHFSVLKKNDSTNALS